MNTPSIKFNNNVEIIENEKNNIIKEVYTKFIQKNPNIKLYNDNDDKKEDILYNICIMVVSTIHNNNPNNIDFYINFIESTINNEIKN